MINKSTATFIVVLGLIALVLGYNYFARPFSKLAERKATNNAVAASPAPSQNQTTKQIDELTDAQKITQLIAAPYNVASDSARLAWITTNQPGFVTLFGQKIDASMAADAVTEIKQTRSLATPVWIAVDHEGGTVQRLAGAGFTKLPSWKSLCQQSDLQFKTLLATSAAELKKVGVDVILAPVVDVGDSVSLGSRICSTKATEVVDKATQMITIFRQAGMLPVVKHFPGIGQTTQDLHGKFDQVTIGVADASVYRSLLSPNSHLGVMMAPVGVKNQYPDIPCVLSPDCVAELSRNFPQALVFTDALEMKANFHVSGTKPEPTLSEVAAQAVLSGNQVLIFGPTVTVDQLTQLVNDLVTKYQTDPAFKLKIEAALNQIISYKQTGQ